MANFLVSIIIPTFERSHIIGETLDSIIRQTYTNWECIVVDDGSSDNTALLLDQYCRKESRIKFYRKPIAKQKGANSCRNFGFSKSSGQFIIWFDSDDLMTSDHIEVKVNAIISKNLDFVIGKTRNFRGVTLLEPYYYEVKPYGIKAEDFILLRIHWYTYDVMLKRNIAEQIQWNERMNSWQDYNYFCKMLLLTERGGYIDKVLTHRRLHANSIQAVLTKNKTVYFQELLENRILTYFDIFMIINENTRKELIHGMMNLCFEVAKLGRKPKNLAIVMGIVKNYFGNKQGVFFISSVVTAQLFQRGHFLLECAKGR